MKLFQDLAEVWNQLTPDERNHAMEMVNIMNDDPNSPFILNDLTRYDVLSLTDACQSVLANREWKVEAPNEVI